MKNNFHKFFVFGVLLLTVLGCSSFLNKLKKGAGSDSGKPQVMLSKDGSYQLTVPGDWSKQADLNSEATLQAANPREELYVIVIQENKGDFPKGATIDTVVKLTRENANKTISNAKLSEPVTTIVNGNTARQFEVGGTVSGIDAKYLYSIVETSGSYYQVMSWTLASHYAENKPILQEVINSFKESK
jgi:hypothetical protein